MQEHIIAFDEGIRRGLRPRENSAKNSQQFIQLDGLYVKDEVLHSLEGPDLIDTSSLDCSFPFPQIFDLTTITLVCTATKVYEYNHSTQTFSQLISVSEGSTWTCADYYEFIVMTNGRALIYRDANSGKWALYADCEIPYGICVCNLNGQLIIGGPEVQISAGFRG